MGGENFLDVPITALSDIHGYSRPWLCNLFNIHVKKTGEGGRGSGGM